MKLTYIGSDERVFPSLGVTVNPGDEVDVPEGFSHPDFAGSKKATKPSASSDTKAGE